MFIRIQFCIHQRIRRLFFTFSNKFKIVCTLYYILMFSSIAGIDGMIAWNLGAFLSFLLVLSTWAAEFNIRASALLPIRHTVRTALLNNSYIHRKKRFTSFPSPAGMSLTKLPLGRNNSVMTSLFPPGESLVVTSRLGTGNSQNFFFTLYELIKH
jgi:hypothetical protein